MKIWINARDEKPTEERYYNTIVMAGEFKIEKECLWIPKSRKWLPKHEGNLNNVILWEKEI